jgi:hypothetical protein
MLFVDARGEVARVVFDAAGERRISALIQSVVAIDAAAVAEALLCGEITTPRARFWPPRPRGGVYELTSEACLKLVGMFALRKAEDRHVDIILTIRVAAPAQ